MGVAVLELLNCLIFGFRMAKRRPDTTIQVESSLPKRARFSIDDLLRSPLHSPDRLEKESANGNDVWQSSSNCVLSSFSVKGLRFGRSGGPTTFNTNFINCRSISRRFRSATSTYYLGSRGSISSPVQHRMSSGGPRAVGSLLQAKHGDDNYKEWKVILSTVYSIFSDKFSKSTKNPPPDS